MATMETREYDYNNRVDRMREAPIVGYLVVKEGATAKLSYECAAWYTDLALKPGRYPIVDRAGFCGVPDHARYKAVVPAVVTGSDFQSLWCGTPIGKVGANRDRDVGEEREYAWTCAEYALARYYVLEPRDGADMTVELAPEYEARYQPFRGLDGDWIVSTGIIAR